MKPKIISQKLKFNNDYLKVIRQKIRIKEDRVVEWDTYKTIDVVSAVVLDKKNNIFLVKEWRAAHEKEIIEIVGGGAKGNTEEKRIKQLRNEIREEIGFDAKKIEKLGVLLRGARISGAYHIYLARDLIPHKKKPGRDEVIEVVKIPFMKAYNLIFKDSFLKTPDTVFGLMMARKRLKM